jgi:transcriptional regulator with XRE-family HTH domain
MHDTSNARPSYDVALIIEDMSLKGWLASHLAHRARVSEITISRFLRGEVQTAPTAKKIAIALGHTVRRYLISARKNGRMR